MKQPETL